MPEAETVSGVVRLLSACYRTSALIGVDGTDGVGKTTLANQLGQAIGAAVISLDNFVTENQGAYVSNLQIGKLREAIGSAGRPLIVEGVCLLDALARLCIHPEVHVYVKRVDGSGFWRDEDTCDPEEEEGILIARLSGDAANFAKLDAQVSGDPVPVEGDIGLTVLRHEILRYHRQYRPSRRAQVSFLRKAAD